MLRAHLASFPYEMSPSERGCAISLDPGAEKMKSGAGSWWVCSAHKSSVSVSVSHGGCGLFVTAAHLVYPD